MGGQNAGDQLSVVNIGFKNLQFNMYQPYRMSKTIQRLLVARAPIIQGIEKMIFQSHFSRLDQIIKDT